MSLPLKTKQLRKHAANRSAAAQSHRKCIDFLKTIEVELNLLAGVTVTEQGRTIQEARQRRFERKTPRKASVKY